MADNRKTQKTDKATPAAPKTEVKEAAPAAVVAPSLPKSLYISMVGKRHDLDIHDVGIETLTSEGKLDRDAVFQIGRLSETPDNYTVKADGVQVASLKVGKTDWSITYNGKTPTVETVARGATKKSSKTLNDDGTYKVDMGPDLFKAVTALVNKLFPQMKQTRTGSASGRTATAKVNTRNAQLKEGILQLASLLKVSPKEAATKLKLDDATFNELFPPEAEAPAPVVAEEPAKAPANGKGRGNKGKAESKAPAQPATPPATKNAAPSKPAGTVTSTPSRTVRSSRK